MRDLIIKVIANWSEGNRGALTFMMNLLKQPQEISEPIFEKLTRCKSIRGTNAYVLWSDLCDRDMYKVKTLYERCPDDILEDASSRQDYSGRELVKEYFDD